MPRLFPSMIHALMLAAALSGCRTPGGVAGTKATLTGPTVTRPAWIKSPESIEGTITKAWGLTLTEAERWKYLQSIYTMLGGTQVLASKAVVDEPNELFALALDNLSGFLAPRLVEKELAAEATGQQHSFDGLGLSDADAGCFDDDARGWCDLEDGVTIGALAKAGLDPAAPSKAWRKRLMHNVQDIGEFMLLAIDDTLPMPGGTRHAADFLVGDVLLPTLLAAGPMTAQSEAAAWTAVVYTILMSGGFYLEAPPQTNPLSTEAELSP